MPLLMGMMGGGWGYGGMMGGTTGPAPSPDMPVDEDEAIELAQKYLDTVRPNTTADEEAAIVLFMTTLSDGYAESMSAVAAH